MLAEYVPDVNIRTDATEEGDPAQLKTTPLRLVNDGLLDSKVVSACLVFSIAVEPKIQGVNR